MDIMNIIHDICLTKIRIKNTPKWKFISKNKLNKKLHELSSEFLKSDIFSVSDNMITFLLSLDRSTICNNIKINDNFSYGNNFINMSITSNTVTTIFAYYPETNRFEVWNNHIAYTIYRNNKICNRVNILWEPFSYDIKVRYLKMIIQLADCI